jgi:hypothetical protein
LTTGTRAAVAAAVAAFLFSVSGAARAQETHFVLPGKRLSSFAEQGPPFLWDDFGGTQYVKQSNGTILESASVSVKGPAHGSPAIDGTLRVTVFPPDKERTQKEIVASLQGLRETPHVASKEFSKKTYLYSTWSTQKVSCQEAVRGAYPTDDDEDEFGGMLSLVICADVPKETFVSWFDRIELKEPTIYARELKGK